MSFDHHVAAEPQYFAHQSTVLITVDDDHSVNALIDGHNDEPKIRDALPESSTGAAPASHEQRPPSPAKSSRLPEK